MALLEHASARPTRPRAAPQDYRYPSVHADPRKRAATARVTVSLFYLNLVAVLGLFVGQGGITFFTSFHELWSAVGRLTALLGTNLLLVQMLLMSRAPWVEQHYGLDRLTIWHRRLGHTAFNLIVAHVLFIVLGYSGMMHRSFWAEAVSLSLESRNMLMAVVAAGLLVLIVATSIRMARAKLRRETWFFIHLYAYASVVLAIPHQLTSGADFMGHLPTQLYWGACYIFVIWAILFFRVWLPLRNAFHHNLRVADVILENDQTISIVVTGRRLEELQAQSGQFFIWRFLCRGHWFEAHPYSLSAAPRRNSLRVTVKALGDGSARLRDIPLGTRVIAEGPFGVFTAQKRTHRKVLMIAGGVGVTPTRALLESIPARRGDITFVYRVRHPRDAVLIHELQGLANQRQARLEVVVGERDDYPSHNPPLGPRHLLQVVPNVQDHDVYVCGPAGLTNFVLASLYELGLDDKQIHYESFEM